MYFYEVLGKCDLEVVVHEFLKLAVDSSDINVTEEAFRGAMKWNQRSRIQRYCA